MTIMLRDRLYTLTPIDGNGSEARFVARIDASHPIFEGHFPAQPILPGVCTLAMLRDAVARMEGRPVRFDRIRDCKFTAPVDPRTTDSLELHIAVSEGEVRAAVSDGERAVLKLKATYALQDE